MTKEPHFWCTATSLLICACASQDPGSASPLGGKADENRDDGTCDGGMVTEQLTFQCVAECGFEDCHSSDNKAELIATLERRHGSKLIVVPTNPKEQWRYDFPCFRAGVRDGQRFEGFTVEVAVFPIPTDVHDMDWGLCSDDVSASFRRRFDADTQVRPGSTLAEPQRGRTRSDRAEYIARVLDGAGTPYLEYFATFNLGCMAGDNGARNVP